jgi:hypothetical protein
MLILNGKQGLGGAMLTPESIATSDAPKKLIGSIMFFESDSLETLRRRLESDIYYTSGVVRGSNAIA